MGKDWLDWAMVQGDTAPSLPATLREADKSFARLQDASKVEFIMKREGADQPKVQREASIKDAAKGQVVYAWDPGDTDEPGYFLAHMKVTYNDGSVATYPGGRFWEIEIRPKL